MAARHQHISKRIAQTILKQAYVWQGKASRRKAGRYTYVKQFKRLRKVVKRQPTILGTVLCKVKRKINQATEATALTLTNLHTLMQHAEHIRSRTSERQEQAIRSARA